MNKKSSEISMQKAAGLNFLSKYTVVIVQVLYNAVMARILLPEEFGVVSILSVFTGFFTMIADFGIGNAIIQRQDIEDVDVDSAFVFATIIGIALGLVLVLLAKPISLFYSNSEYLKMVPLLSIAVVFNTMSNIPAAILMKQKKFKIVAARQIIINILACVLAVIMALCGGSYYSLVFYTIITAIANFVWNFLSCGHKFKVRMYSASLKKFMGFSINLMLYNSVTYLSKSLDRLILGRTMGDESVGNYNKSVQLTTYPVNYLALVITPTILPYLSSHQDDKKYVYDKFIKLTKFLSLIGAFIAVYLAMASDEVITIMYGSNWSVAAQCFRWHAFSIWPQMIVAACSSVYQVLDKTKELFRTSVIALILSAVAVLLGSAIGSLEAVAIFVMIMYYIVWIYMTFELAKLMEVSFAKLMKKYTFEFFAVIILTAILLLFSHFITISNVVLSAIVKAMIFGVVAYIMLNVTKEYKWIINVLPGKFSKKLQMFFLK